MPPQPEKRKPRQEAKRTRVFERLVASDSEYGHARSKKQGFLHAIGFDDRARSRASEWFSLKFHSILALVQSQIQLLFLWYRKPVASVLCSGLR